MSANFVSPQILYYLICSSGGDESNQANIMKIGPPDLELQCCNVTNTYIGNIIILIDVDFFIYEYINRFAGWVGNIANIAFSNVKQNICSSYATTFTVVNVVSA